MSSILYRAYELKAAKDGKPFDFEVSTTNQAFNPPFGHTKLSLIRQELSNYETEVEFKKMKSGSAR